MMIMDDLNITHRKTIDEDWNIIGDKLTAYTQEQGAPDYNPLSTTFNAVSDGKLVCQAIATQNWGKAEVDMLYVEDTERGQGVGTQMMTAIEDWARAHDLRAIRLNTPTWQGAGFYEKSGYEEMGRIPLDPDAEGNPHWEVTYFKILQPQ